MKKSILIVLIVLLSGSSLAATSSQGLVVNILSTNLTVYSPEEGLYEFRMIPINLTMLSKVKYFKYSDNDLPFRTLCRNCEEYGYSKLKRKPFDDGYHELAISVRFEEYIAYYYVNFTVDTLPPKIRKTEPRRGFANGSFSVEFQEANPKEIILHYGNNISGPNSQTLDLNSCIENRRNRKLCQVNVDLSEYDNEEIEYWFGLRDVSDNYAESKPKKLNVDFSPPIVNDFDLSYNRRRVTFFFNISEPNFKRSSYIDSEDGRERLLCTKLTNNICEKTKSFSMGTHNITIEILDDAGNREIIDEVVFEV